MTVQERELLQEAVRRRLEDKFTVVQMREVLDAIGDAVLDMEAEEANEGRDCDSLMQVFLQAKRIEGRSEKTIERYRYIISRMLEDAGVPIGSITVYHLRQYMASELQRGISESTIKGYQDIFSSLFGWLWREGLIKTNPCGNLGSIKTPKVQRLSFTRAEIEQIKENCNTTRDKAVVCFLLATGCRITEAIMLNRQDIDFVNMECTVQGKGKKERTVYLDDVAAAMLKRYLNERTDQLDALFVSRLNKRMTPNGIRTMLKRIENRSGVENIHPHRFRRTLATNLANKGMNIQEIAHILGHEKLDTTMKYVCVQKTTVKQHYQAIVA